MNFVGWFLVLLAAALVFQIFLMRSCWDKPILEAPAQCVMLLPGH